MITERGKGLHQNWVEINRQRSVARGEHRIKEIRSRKEDAHLNFIECFCEWKGPPEAFPGHRLEVGAVSRH